VAGWYSRSAHQKITAAGGTAQNIKGEAFAFPKPKKKFVPRDTKAAGKKAKGAPAAAEGEAPAAAQPAEGGAATPAPAAAPEGAPAAE
jgi:hypothetical protein